MILTRMKNYNSIFNLKKSLPIEKEKLKRASKDFVTLPNKSKISLEKIIITQIKPANNNN